VAALEVKRTLYRAARNARDPRRFLDDRRIRAEFVRRFLGGDGAALALYERELREAGLRDHLLERGREHKAAVERSGEQFSLGAIGYAEGAYLYAIVRTLRPAVAVETGVANGFSTAFLLQALHANGDGPGWLIPDALRDRWTLHLGRSQDELPPLLERLGTIDFFMHDSEHSYDCMWFEFNAAWPCLRDGGVLVSDDVNSTPAFPQFAGEVSREPLRLARGMSILTK